MAERELRHATDLLAVGDWQAGHVIVQEDDSTLAAWRHGIVHTLEGDLDNAIYWYKDGRAFRGRVAVNDEIIAARREAFGPDAVP